jgi:ribosome maturation factor RimP
MSTEQRVRDLVAPLFGDGRTELVDVEHTRGVVRITVDREGVGPDDGVSADELADLTRRISRVLDDADPVPGRYTLEVSSPGLERPLRTPSHFVRAVGAKVNVKTRSSVEGDRRIVGALTAADEDGITVQPEATSSKGEASGDARHLRYEEIERARTVFDWGPAPKPGKSGAPKPPEKKART